MREVCDMIVEAIEAIIHVAQQIVEVLIYFVLIEFLLLLVYNVTYDAYLDIRSIWRRLKRWKEDHHDRL